MKLMLAEFRKWLFQATRVREIGKWIFKVTVVTLSLVAILALNTEYPGFLQITLYSGIVIWLFKLDKDIKKLKNKDKDYD